VKKSVIAVIFLVLIACGVFYVMNGRSKAPQTADAVKTSKEELKEGSRKQYTLLTGSSGGQYFTFGTAMANSINEKSKKIEVSALTASSSSEVMNLIQNGEADFGFVTYDTAYMAASSQREYKGKPAYKNIRIVMLGHTGQKTIVTYEKDGFKTIADLKNATIACGNGTSAHASDTAAFIPWGIDLDKAKRVMLGYGDMATAMKDGTVQAAIAHGPNPVSYIINMASAGKIRILGQTRETLAQILNGHPEWVETVIPAGTYKDVDYDVLTFANYSTIICRKDIPADDVEEFLRIVFDTDLTKVYAYGDQWGRANKYYPAAMKNNEVLPFHEGSLSFLKQNGFFVNEVK
jgi:TRAP transporter TAXI family solute receptor